MERQKEQQGIVDSVDWIYDEDRDWYYTVAEVKKVEGSYKWIDENNIRTRGGARFEVVDHDDSVFRLKVWKPTLREASSATPDAVVDPVAQAEVVKRQTHWAQVDRVVLEGAQQGLPTSGQWRNNFDLADMDGDGNLDILFGPSRKGRATPNIFLGDGQGHWRTWSEARFAQRPLDYGGAAAGDLNGDGLMDAAFGIHLRGLMAFVNDGSTQFVPWDEGIAWDHPGAGGDATSFSSRRLDIVDWDGDGDMDIVALGEGPKGMRARGGKPGGGPSTLIDNSRGLVLYTNEGDGSWVAYRLDAGVDFGDHFELGDLDGDGRLDVALASRRGGTKEVLRIRDADGRLQPVGIEGLRTGAFLSSIALDDLDGDGHQDVLVGYRATEDREWQSGVDLFFGAADGSWDLVPLVAIDGRSDFTAIDTGDFDGDSHRDVVLLTGYGSMEIYLGEGGRTFAEEAVSEAPADTKGCTGWSVAAKDLDHDGRDDIVAAFAGEAAGVVGIAQISVPGCAGGGSLRAWLSRDTR
ncbi:MAG: VCBS repeat-containing protein [Thermoanaerobaculia bacterium]|nr:VCBS repeat-containing protein [Thermoanaerobaculia bacterium]